MLLAAVPTALDGCGRHPPTSPAKGRGPRVSCPDLYRSLQLSLWPWPGLVYAPVLQGAAGKRRWSCVCFEPAAKLMRSSMLVVAIVMRPDSVRWLTDRVFEPAATGRPVAAGTATRCGCRTHCSPRAPTPDPRQRFRRFAHEPRHPRQPPGRRSRLLRRACSRDRCRSPRRPTPPPPQNRTPSSGCEACTEGQRRARHGACALVESCR